jgi:alkylation response protein AidB-like acyl-CoA dehydrogenase
MDLALTEDQEMLKKVAADFVKAEVPAHQMTQWYKNKQTFQPQLIKKAAELGWLGMMLPEAFGGAGVSTMDCAVVFEELGHGPVPGPLFTSGILSAQMIYEAGTDAQRKALLPPLCAGKSIVVPALMDKAAYWGPQAVETRLSKTPSGYLMSGAKRFVFDAQAATSFLCAARSEEGKVVFLLVDAKSPGITITPHIGFFVSVAEVKFDKVAVASENLLGSSGASWATLESALDKSLPILSAYQVGATQEVFDLTCDYTNSRVVFGQLIGRFQRVQDHCVDISINLDMARWATYEAIWRIDSGMDARAGVHEAKATASDGYYHGTNYAHMVWAGPGTDYGHPMMAHSVLAHTLYQYLGTPGHHKRLMMDALYPRA